MADDKTDKLATSPNRRVAQGFSDVVTESDALSPTQAGQIARAGLSAKPIAGAGHNPPKPKHNKAQRKLPRALRGKGRISARALKRFQKMAGHNPPKPAHSRHLTARARQALPKSDFALPGKGEGPKGAGSGSYPIPDAGHARAALSRSAGKPVAAAVRARVRAKFPGMKVSKD